MRIKGLPVLPTLSVDVALCMLMSAASAVSIGSGVWLGLATLGSGKWSAVDDTSEMEDGVLPMEALLLVRDAVLDVFDRTPSSGTHRPSLPLPRASSTALAAAWSRFKGRPLPVAHSPFLQPSFLQPSVNWKK